MEEYIEKYLKNNKIDYKLYTHPAVFTVEEAKEHCKDIPGMHCKNLFLKEKVASSNRSASIFLVTMNAHKRLDIKELAKKLEVKALTFCSENLLMEKLKIKPGSVSPLGLINNNEKDVIFVVDKEVWDSQEASFHPNDNRATLVVKKEAFHKLVESFRNNKKILEL